jgi:transcription elongation factor Elf1
MNNCWRCGSKKIIGERVNYQYIQKCERCGLTIKIKNKGMSKYVLC